MIELISLRTLELVSLIVDYAYWLRELAQFGVAISTTTPRPIRASPSSGATS